MQVLTSAETSLPESPQLSVESYVSYYRKVLVRDGVRGLLQLIRERLLGKLGIWFFAFRSFRGHIRVLSAKGQANVRFGPAFESLPNGCYRRNIRTVARRLYTEKLLATRFSWADCQDLEIFLMGFDAGAAWETHTDSTLETQTGYRVSWLTSDDDAAIHEVLRRIAEQDGLP
jgi:hypothetical protein